MTMHRLARHEELGAHAASIGIAAARAIAAWFGLADRIEFGAIDFTDPNDGNFGRLKDMGVLSTRRVAD
jgi:hypothetical protein